MSIYSMMSRSGHRMAGEGLDTGDCHTEEEARLKMEALKAQRAAAQALVTPAAPAVEPVEPVTK